MPPAAAASEDAAPLDARAFDALLAPFGPFERAPRLAVAVSGGADSLALACLADDWARARGGRIAALIVDHRLRPDSTAEARAVAAMLGALGIEAHLLTRPGGPVTRALQAEARAARYRLLEDWCRAAGVLHLLVAHQREDQAETLLMRLERASGLDGLAAMASVVERRGLRILRPLLTVPRARLEATLRARGLAWIDDPSNRDPRFARARIRALAPALDAAGLGVERLARAAAAFGGVRSAGDRALAALLARAVALHPAGFCRLDPEPLRAAPEPIAARALARVLTCIGGGVYPPRGRRLARLLRALDSASPPFAGRTLGGCRILPRRGRLLVCREAGAIAETVRLAPGRTAFWDRRFALAVAPGPGARPVTVRRLGEAGWARLAAAAPALAETPIPPPVRPGLPAFFDLDDPVAVPHLGFVREDGDRARFSALFRPAHPLAAACFAFAGMER